MLSYNLTIEQVEALIELLEKNDNDKMLESCLKTLKELKKLSKEGIYNRY